MSVIDINTKNPTYVGLDAYNRILEVSPFGDIAFVCSENSNEAVAIDLNSLAPIDGAREECGRFVFFEPGRARSLATGNELILTTRQGKFVIDKTKHNPKRKSSSKSKLDAELDKFGNRELLFSAQKHALYKTDGRFEIYSFQNGRVIWRSADTSPTPLAITDSLLALNNENYIELIDWSKETKERKQLDSGWKLSGKAAFSPDGRKLIAAAEDGRIGIWQIEGFEYEEVQTVCCHNNVETILV